MVKNQPANVGDRGRTLQFDPWVGKIPWRRKWQPTPVFLHGENPMDRGTWWAAVHEISESDMTEDTRAH